MYQQNPVRKWLTALSVYLGVTAALSAGVVYEIEVRDHEQSPPTTETMEAAVEGRNLSIGIAAKGSHSQGDMIFHGKQREMIVVDHDSRSYFVMDEAQMQQLAGQVNDAMSQMSEMLKNVPEDQRAMVEQMMKERMPEHAPQQAASTRQLKKTGEKAKKNGYPCVRYELWNDGRKIREIWVTDWDNLEGGEEAAEAFVDMAEFMRALMDKMPKMSQQGSGLDDNMFENMKEMGGFPVLNREFDESGKLVGEGVLRSARRASLDPAAFEPPAGYKRQSMFPQ